MWSLRKKVELPTPEDALPGRPAPIRLTEPHTVLGTALEAPYPEGLELLDVGMGCFWGAERTLWKQSGVWTTLVGYQGGITPNPTYEETCTGLTGHTEVVRVVFDPTKTSYEVLLKVFWEAHDPTQGMRQGNDVGTTYRSAIYPHSGAQQAAAVASREAYGAALARAGKGPITTEILPAGPFYNAEPYHQQYLSDAKNPHGYCSMTGTGVSCPIGTGVVSD